ncbi:uncharacterized protein LOC108711174 isoform X3 [Xenopus laevis]|uniref:Uncharacterized protein LOC108711174 isoform X3 n=1 Tax=Xenopus laevis TaxID=8355 RepID=A0A8J1MKV1_XENLA|nr:uncharacterized protein LOC108711174 isoform X3 [Xenopus laevis]
MNWVGGSRSRILFKQERKRQKEFFEKQKLMSKINRSGSVCQENSSISLDLLNLYFVNQISRKMESANKKMLNIDIKSAAFPLPQNNTELPMTPTAVKSTICLEDHEVTCSEKKFLCTDPEDRFQQRYDREQNEQNEDMPGESYEGDSGVWQMGEPGLQGQFLQCSPETSEMFFSIKEITNRCKSDTYNVPLLSDMPHTLSIRKESQLDVSGKHHAWSQTDSSLHTADKHDVSVQCDILQEYKCSECSLGNNSRQVINLTTMRGQHTPLNELFRIS